MNEYDRGEQKSSENCFHLSQKKASPRVSHILIVTPSNCLKIVFALKRWHECMVENYSRCVVYSVIVVCTVVSISRHFLGGLSSLEFVDTIHDRQS